MQRNKPSKNLGRHRQNVGLIMILIASFLIVICILIIYSPAFKHVYRADHWCWIADTAKTQNSFCELFEKTYSYNRQRLMAPGDHKLYRPLLIGYLCLKQSLFGHNLWAHQFSNIFLFSLSCLILFILAILISNFLNQYHCDTKDIVPCPVVNLTHIFPAFLCTLFIAVNPMNYELAVWSHIGGYVIAFAIFFIGMIIMVIGTNPQRIDVRMLWPAILLFALACFFYEIIFVSCCVLALSVIIAYNKSLGRRSLYFALLLISPVIVYQAFNYIDFYAKILPAVKDT